MNRLDSDSPKRNSDCIRRFFNTRRLDPQKALMIPRGFTVGIQPLGEVRQNAGNSVRHRGQRTENEGRRTAVREHSESNHFVRLASRDFVVVI